MTHIQISKTNQGWQFNMLQDNERQQLKLLDLFIKGKGDVDEFRKELEEFVVHKMLTTKNDFYDTYGVLEKSVDQVNDLEGDHIHLESRVSNLESTITKMQQRAENSRNQIDMIRSDIHSFKKGDINKEEFLDMLDGDLGMLYNYYPGYDL